MSEKSENIIKTFILGPLENNTYLIIDTETKDAVIIDPAFDSERILNFCQNQQYSIRQIWLTHAHFDHIAGIHAIVNNVSHPVSIFLHPKELTLYQNGGDAANFGINIPKLPEPTDTIQHKQILSFGNSNFVVLHTPGHSEGHVTFYCEDQKLAFCGDLIFFRSIGRTDLPGGSYPDLISSVREHIFTLPPDTKLFSGHGPDTTVKDEQNHNPFFNQ